MPVPSQRVQNIRVTTVARTFLDLGECAAVRGVCGALEDAAVAKRLDLADLAELMARAVHSHPHAVPMLTPLMERMHNEEVPSESRLELRLHEALAEAGVTGVARQMPLPWWPDGPQRVDAAVPAVRTIIEADGRRWHTRISDFDRDLWRDNQATLNGWSVLRYTWYRLTKRRNDVRSELRTLARQIQHSA